MHESTLAVDGGQMYYRHSDFDRSRPTVLFVHGIGESGLCFLEAFHYALSRDFNIVVPDLPGFGRSSAAADHDYSFAKQILRLRELLDVLGAHKIHLVGHSMGGNIGTLFCQQHTDQVVSFVNIEGDLSADNRFIIDQTLQAESEGRFEDWLRADFASKQVVDWSHQWPSTVRYLASLNLCQSRAFLASAREIDATIAPVQDSNLASIGKSYIALQIPRIFCWGRESLADSSRTILEDHAIRHEEFRDAFHWVMLDQPARFYAFLSDFLAGQDR